MIPSTLQRDQHGFVAGVVDFHSIFREGLQRRQLSSNWASAAVPLFDCTSRYSSNSKFITSLHKLPFQLPIAEIVTLYLTPESILHG